MTTYRVGQVVYAVLRKEAKVIPLQVIEEITKRSLNGEETTYMVKVGKDAKTAAIASLDAEIFDNADAARSMLVERATQAITQRVDDAVAVAKEWYPSGFEARSEDPLALLTKQEPAAEPAQQPAPRRPAPPRRQAGSMVKPEVAALAAEFAAEANAGGEAFIELPDGTKAKVGKVKLPAELQG